MGTYAGNCWGGGDVPDENDRVPGGTMHAANIEKSERLLQTLAVVKAFRHGGIRGRDIQLHTGSLAVATDISEVRANGHEIDCVYEGKTENGRRIYRYFYRGKKEN
jgi:hypothetical protein